MKKTTFENIIFGLVFLILIVMCIYSIYVQNQYNDLVIECNDIKRGYEEKPFLVIENNGGNKYEVDKFERDRSR